MLDTLSREQLDQLSTKVEEIIALGNKMYPLINESLGILKCRELQMIAMDLESMGMHLNKLNTEGPSEPFEEIPLEQSEISEENVIPLVQTEGNESHVID